MYLEARGGCWQLSKILISPVRNLIGAASHFKQLISVWDGRPSSLAKSEMVNKYRIHVWLNWLKSYFATKIELSFVKQSSIFFEGTAIPCKGQPEAHYSKFSFKQYFPFQHQHLTLDLTKIHENFFLP